MAKPNYQFEKRQRDLAKKSKQDEKRRQKLAAKAGDGLNEDEALSPSEAAPASLPVGRMRPVRSASIFSMGPLRIVDCKGAATAR